MARDTPDEDYGRLLKAIAHPLRQRILFAIDEAGEASPKSVAHALGAPLGRVSHHVRVLLRLGAIELTRTEPRRGATEHYYRATLNAWLDDEAWGRMPPDMRRSVSHATLRHLLEHTNLAARGAGFDHPRTHVSYTMLDLDERGVNEIAAVLEEALDRVQAIKAEAAERLGDTTPSARMELGILYFERG